MLLHKVIKYLKIHSEFERINRRCGLKGALVDTLTPDRFGKAVRETDGLNLLAKYFESNFVQVAVLHSSQSIFDPILRDTTLCF